MSTADLVAIIKEKGYRRLPEPVQLASGEMSQDFVDGKQALADGADLRTACEALIAALDEMAVAFDAVGGMTMGADQFAHVMAVLAAKQWFVVRKAPKGRGTNKLVEGAPLGPGVRCVVVEDVVTTGGSMWQACARVQETGAVVVAALTLVDRGEAATQLFAGKGIPYRALVTYRDLGIEPVGGGLVATS